VAFADSARVDDTRAEDAVGLLADQVEPRLNTRVPYVVDLRTDQLFIGGAVQTGLFRELARRGFDMRVDPADDYLGRSHAADSHTAHLIVCAGSRIEAPGGPGVKQVGNVLLASADDVARMRRLDAELHDFIATPANLTRRGRAALEQPGSEDALVLQRLLDAADNPQRANDALIAMAHELVRIDDQVFDRLRVAVADAHDLVEQYVFKVYVIP